MRFEYKYVKLLDDFNGQKAVEDMLNRMGSEGWELVQGVVLNGWGIMKRAVAVAAGDSGLRKVA